MLLCVKYTESRVDPETRHTVSCPLIFCACCSLGPVWSLQRFLSLTLFACSMVILASGFSCTVSSSLSHFTISLSVTYRDILSSELLLYLVFAFYKASYHIKLHIFVCMSFFSIQNAPGAQRTSVAWMGQSQRYSQRSFIFVSTAKISGPW